MAKDSSDYFKEWYSRNRDEFLARRRERYTSDTEYAERQRRYTKESRDRKKSGEIQEGKTLNDLARALDLSTGTLRYWLKQGYMPTPQKHESSGRYIVSDESIALIKSAFAQIGGRLKPTNIEQFQQLTASLVDAGWTKSEQ